MPRSPVPAASRTASASRSSISSTSSIAVERVGQRGQRLRQRAVLLAVQAAGQRQRADGPAPEPLGVRVGRGEVAARRAGLAAVEADHGGDAEIAAGHAGFVQVLGQGAHLGQRVVPAPRLEEQLAQGAVRLSQPERRADLVRELPGLPGRGQRLLVPVEIAQRDGLVQLQQQPQVGQRGIGLGHGQRPVEQRQRLGHVPARRGHQRHHEQRPAHGPVVACLRRRRERVAATRPAFSTSLLLRCVRAASTSSRARCRAEIPGEASARSSEARDSARLPGQHAALGQRPVQIHEEIGLGGVLQRAVGHLLGRGPVTDAVEGVGEPAGQPVRAGPSRRRCWRRPG